MRGKCESMGGGGMAWSYMAQDGGRWWDLVNVGMNLWFPTN